jgi:hypothetical protein
MSYNQRSIIQLIKAASFVNTTPALQHFNERKSIQYLKFQNSHYKLILRPLSNLKFQNSHYKPILRPVCNLKLPNRQ